MPRIFIAKNDVSADSVTISDKEQLHHLSAVLRLKTKEPLTAVDEKGNIYSTIIEEISRRSMVLRIKKIDQNLTAGNKSSLTVACAIPKKSRIDDIIDTLTQLGVDRIIPLKTARVVVEMDKAKEADKLMRWRKIAQSAAQQSQRNTLPLIEPVMGLDEVLAGSDNYNLKLIPALIDQHKTLKQALANKKAKNILVLIGPEGDFTPQELAACKGQGFIPVTLGEQVLRVATAAAAVAGFIRLNEDN
jgi:16S rRNA (uracil1498-N3)-methyltransferase